MAKKRKANRHRNPKQMLFRTRKAAVAFADASPEPDSATVMEGLFS